jgi:hypothetical protein
MPPLNVVIDISHYNRDVDFAAAKQAGILGVIHKATQGSGGVDPTYAGPAAHVPANWPTLDHVAVHRRRLRP